MLIISKGLIYLLTLVKLAKLILISKFRTAKWLVCQLICMRARLIFKFTFFKMLLNNRKDLINFDHILVISSFHGVKSPNYPYNY